MPADGWDSALYSPPYGLGQGGVVRLSVWFGWRVCCRHLLAAGFVCVSGCRCSLICGHGFGFWLRNSG
ncbi:MAG: hypothetical protein ABIK43_06835, partial [candidate division WOR-3 bacterium]